MTFQVSSMPQLALGLLSLSGSPGQHPASRSHFAGWCFPCSSTLVDRISVIRQPGTIEVALCLKIKSACSRWSDEPVTVEGDPCRAEWASSPRQRVAPPCHYELLDLTAVSSNNWTRCHLRINLTWAFYTWMLTIRWVLQLNTLP